MTVMMLFWLVVMVMLAFATVRLSNRRLPPDSTSHQDGRLAEQAERIEQLEGEVHRLQEQADFTEKLLTERSGSPPRDALDSGDAPD